MAILIPTVRDDAGLRRLQKLNASRAAGVVTPVDAPPATEERAEVMPVLPYGRRREEPEPPARDRRQQDRRQGDRRQTQRPVLLDTRTQHERRRQLRRRQDEEADGASSAPTTGIDIFV